MAEPNELEIGPVGEGNECVVRDAIGMLAAGGDGEAAASEVVDRGLKIAEDEDHVVELAEHCANR